MSPVNVGPGISLNGSVTGSQVVSGAKVGVAVTLSSTVASGAVSNVPKTIKEVIIAESFYYEHVQIAPAATWTINHNLGKKPNISVYDGNGDEVLIPVTHVNDNTAQVNWSQPSTGRAYCS